MSFPVFHALSPLLWLLLLPMAGALLKLPVVKGHLGESWLRMVAWLRLDRRVYHALHDVTLVTATGSTQIDHIFISIYGLFVVETKHMQGWIFGREGDREWTQQLYRKKIRFQNPLRQNHGHCQALIERLGLTADQVHSVISFVGDSQFKTPLPPCVTQGGGFVRYIRSFRQPVLTQAQVASLLAQIKQQRLPPGRATRRRHIRQLQARRTAAASPRTPPMPVPATSPGLACPRCSGSLVERKRRRGPQAGTRFLGCSNYPACRHRQ